MLGHILWDIQVSSEDRFTVLWLHVTKFLLTLIEIKVMEFSVAFYQK